MLQQDHIVKDLESKLYMTLKPGVTFIFSYINCMPNVRKYTVLCGLTDGAVPSVQGSDLSLMDCITKLSSGLTFFECGTIVLFVTAFLHCMIIEATFLI